MAAKEKEISTNIKDKNVKEPKNIEPKGPKSDKEITSAKQAAEKNVNTKAPTVETKTPASVENKTQPQPAISQVASAAAYPVSVAPSTPAQDTAMQSFAAGSEGAQGYRQAYDAATAAAMAGGPAAAMERQNQAAREEAQRQSDAAVAQAVKGGKTAGMMGGQAALAATGQAANAYGQGMQQGQQQYNQMLGLGAQLGESMAGRLFTAGQGQAGVGASQLGAQTAQYAAQQQAASEKAQRQQNLLGNVIGAVGGIASLFSDRNLKEDIKPANFSDSLDKIRAYTFRYRGKDRPEAGVMAQDLEKTAMAPAVMDTPDGKMIDTRRLTTMNTAALAEQNQRMKDIERMLKGMREVK